MHSRTHLRVRPEESAVCRQLYIQSTPNPSIDKKGLVVVLRTTLPKADGNASLDGENGYRFA